MRKTPLTKTIGDFRTFLLRGNVVDLAVAVVIGAAFGAVVTALVSDFITPLTGLILPGEGAFAERVWAVGGTVGSTDNPPRAVFAWGHFVNAALNFLLVSAVVFFFVVKPINALLKHRRTEPEVESTTRDCPECLSSIPKEAKRCAFCTAQVGAAS